MYGRDSGHLNTKILCKTHGRICSASGSGILFMLDTFSETIHFRSLCRRRYLHGYQLTCVTSMHYYTNNEI